MRQYHLSTIGLGTAKLAYLPIGGPGRIRVVSVWHAVPGRCFPIYLVPDEARRWPALATPAIDYSRVLPLCNEAGNVQPNSLASVSVFGDWSLGADVSGVLVDLTNASVAAVEINVGVDE